MPVSRKTEPCGACGSTETIQVKMTLAGAPTTFTMCSKCEWKGWQREGEQLPLDSVLSLVSKR
jgi:hypothetical protein